MARTPGRRANESRRRGRAPAAAPDPGRIVLPAPIRVGALEFDVLRRTVRIGAESHELTGSMFALLYLLAANEGRVLTGDEIGAALWRPGEMPLGDAVDHLVVLLRSHLRDDAAHPRIVETVPGRGYRLAGVDAPACRRGQCVVLVVDDDAVVRETVRVVLEMDGYRVVTAADLDGALAAVEVVQPCVVLLDGDLPDAASAELGRRWRARAERVAPVVVMAEAERAERRREDLGGAASLPRPFRLDDLYGVVGRLCSRGG